jgi:hypothetical protein
MTELMEVVKKELLRTGLWVVIASVVAFGIAYMWI